VVRRGISREWDVTPLQPKPLDDVIATVPCPVFAAFGSDDHIISIDDVRRFRNSLEQHKKSYEMHLYAGAPHGWLNDTMPGRYRKAQADAGWTRADALPARRVRRRVEGRSGALALRKREQRELRLQEERASGVAVTAIVARRPVSTDTDYPLSRDDALDLIENADLGALLNAASALRDRGKGKIVTYSKKVFIPLTHLCRDYCGYCTFRTDPIPGVAAYMTPDEVLAVAEAGKRAGCKEALFSLGDQPERVFPEAREALRKLGHERTLDYLAAMTELVLEKTGLLPHANPGVMGADDLARLRRSNVSLGLMLENISPRLKQKGGAHWRAPDKAPALRPAHDRRSGPPEDRVHHRLLIGIGETLAGADRLAARDQAPARLDTTISRKC
jgi:hypothetical protein